MIRELTASVLIVRPDDAGDWQTALIWHPRLECWLPAGGTSSPARPPLRPPSASRRRRPG